MNTPRVTVTVAGPAVPTPVVVADVEAGDWSLRITRDGDRYGAVLAGLEFGSGLEVRLWPSLPAVLESVSSYLRARGLSHIASVLRASVEAEVRE